ncbi:MaoC family dehydratase [Deinococcus peraridilitoris]|uniref:Acyl dehydratase n=1 Tax=Deinococcus peraridilitoris (strain DSM 19664 / LMG 22246 / CIP 109416 / KR-200) TaxID=937777 RepID=K9ZZY0_DEIPD|nr:MaoC family dehydratase [Deinococcus peraridilitoris]AFZ66754.1 acyl dehydratase [Deinococcus peraridilitoris DSM 19664]
MSALENLRARLGQELGVSDWVSVSQEMVNQFADATGDHQFIHVDPERAAQTPFGGPIAHGFLTLSLLAGHLSGGRGEALNLGGRMTVNYGLNRVRFVSPVPVGSRLRTHAELLQLEDGPDGQWVQVTTRQTVEIEGAPKPALIAETIFRTYF